MASMDLPSKLAKVPLAKPGFDALGMCAPVIIQMNPEGKWESAKPKSLDEERLKAVVQHLTNSKALSAAQSYCCQCAVENRTEATKSNYVPVIMMPIYAADECPFDLDCEIQKFKEDEPKKIKKNEMSKDIKDTDKEKEKKKLKKRGFVLQRLTDFDLLSQW